MKKQIKIYKKDFQKSLEAKLHLIKIMKNYNDDNNLLIDYIPSNYLINFINTPRRIIFRIPV